MSKIIITGATGFTGSHVLEAFESEPLAAHTVIAACRDTTKLPDAYTGEHMTGDLLDNGYLAQLTSKADVICHTASWAELNGKGADSKKNFYWPTIRLIDSALKNGVKRFVFLSAITSNPIEQNRLHTNRPLHTVWPHYDSIMKIEHYLKSVAHAGMEIVILRAGFFVGKNYALGILPVLLPRLNTHLVPWVCSGKTSMPFIDGSDLGKAFQLAATVSLAEPLNVMTVVGKEVPSVRQVFQYLYKKHNYPLPHFSVSFGFAYSFARIMQLAHTILPGDPLIVPAIVLLLEETHANNEKAKKILGFTPSVHWNESIDVQLKEMKNNNEGRMMMNRK